jgi:hypothetical protein
MRSRLLSADRPLAGFLLLLLLMYVVAVPIVAVYSLLLAALRVLRPSTSITHVTLASLLTRVVWYLPALILAYPSEGEPGARAYAAIFGFVFLPILTAALACWLITPDLHRTHSAQANGVPKLPH